jgi:aminoglycoside phosphotransferase (APT) family kinase protein
VSDHVTGGEPVAGAGAVRDEDAFDAAAVAEWLRGNAVDASGLDAEPEVQQFGGGASNLTYLLRWPERDLILRRPPSGTKAKGAHDMAREYRIQDALAPVYPLVPRMIGYCGDESVIGSEFYVMERVEGLILRRDFPEGVGLDDGAARDRLCGTFVDALRRARTEDVGDFAEVMAWLDAHQPDDHAHTMIHNDFRFDNLVLAADDVSRVAGVLDWELSTVGDPLMDVGSALAYWSQADDPDAMQAIRLQPTNAPGMWTREQVWTAYGEQHGLTISAQDRRFYELFGTFRLAVIAQQIYYRAFHGQTTNPKAAGMGMFVRILDARCTELLG